MKQKNEFAKRIHSEFVGDGFAQLMIGYQNFAQIYGNNKLMYYHYLLSNIKTDENETAVINIEDMQRYVNDYVTDPRSTDFPYSNVPYHVERTGLFKKCNFANQIMDFNKPYIQVIDNFISKITIYKDDDDAIVHIVCLNNVYSIPRKLIVSKNELEEYFKTGSLSGFDNGKYNSVQIFDLNGGLYNIELRSKEFYTQRTNKDLTSYLNIYDADENRYKTKLEKIVKENGDSLEYCVLSNKRMIKFGDNGDINMDIFGVRYVGNDNYLITIANVPLDIEELSNIKKRFGEEKLEYLKHPIVKSLKNKILI